MESGEEESLRAILLERIQELQAAGATTEEIMEVQKQIQAFQAAGANMDEVTELVQKLSLLEEATGSAEESAASSTASSTKGTPAQPRRRSFTPDEIARMTPEEQLAAFAQLEDSDDGFVRDITSDLNPFDVECPYCQRVMQTFDLPSHVASEHADREDEEHRCPICYLASRTQPPKCPLAAHLRAEHSDCQPSEPILAKDEYSTTVLEHDLPEASTCSVCYDLFHKGDEMITMSCMCMFHKKCITAWWERDEERNGKCILHFE